MRMRVSGLDRQWAWFCTQPSPYRPNAHAHHDCMGQIETGEKPILAAGRESLPCCDSVLLIFYDLGLYGSTLLRSYDRNNYTKLHVAATLY